MSDFNNIELLISEAAATKSDSDYQTFFKAAKDVEFFFNYNEENGVMTIPLVDVGNNHRALVFYTSKETAEKSGNLAGIVWEQGLEMIVKMPNANGLIVQNSSSSWIAINKNKIVELLK